MPDDAELLRRYAATRDESAFAALVERHLGLVYSSALRRLGGDPHCAAEVAQNVFIALARHASSLAQRPVLASWLHTATRHAAIDLLRAETRRRTREQNAHALDLVNSPDPTSAEWDQLRPLLDTALDELNEPDRAILLLRFFEQHSFADAAAQLNLTEDAARMRTTRALEKLRHLLARRGLTSTSAALATALTTQTITAAPATLAASVTSGALLGSVTATTSSLLLMTTATKTLLGTAAVALLGLGTALFFQSRQAQENALALAASQRIATALRAENTTLTSSLAAAAKRIAPPSEPSAQPAPSSATPAKPTANPGYNYGFWANPAYAPAFIEQQRAIVRLKYGQLYRELNLTPAEIGDFEKAQIERLQSSVDLYTNAVSQGLNPMDPSFGQLERENTRTMERALAANLGDTRYAQYQQFEKNGLARGYVLAIASYTYDTPTPLAPNQGAALEKLLTANTASKDILVQDGDKTSASKLWETDWPAVFAQAQGVLSPVQLATLQQIAERDRVAKKLQQIQYPIKK